MTVNAVLFSLFMGVGGLALLGGILRLAKNHSAPVRRVFATVIDKQELESFSRYSGDGKRREYIVVFSVEGKKKAFSVFRFSYDSYRLHEKGVLTYKGNRILSFFKT